MISGLLRLILNLAYWIIDIASWLLLLYCIMTFIIPQNKYTQLLGKYVEPMLRPIHGWLLKTFPKMFDSGLDFSPVGLWLLFKVAGWLVQLVRGWL